MSRTESPRSRKYSAIAMAEGSASRRIIGLSSPVDTTVMDRARLSASGPSRNSLTSRPRSPTSATTTVSKADDRAIIDRTVDLPTPEPAKMPTRCPSHSGVNRSMTRTPVRSGRRMRARVIAAGGCRSMRIDASPRSSAPRSSIGSPSALTTRPFQSGVGCRCMAPISLATTPMPTEKRATKGLTVASASSMRTTSQMVDLAPSSRRTRSPSLTSAGRPRIR